MKKKMLLFIFLFFISIMQASAYTTTGDKCIDDGSCMVVCNYTNVGKSSQSAISSYYSSKYNTYASNKYITIYYNYKSNNFAVGLWSGITNVDGKRPYLKGPDSFNNVFSEKGTNVFVQPALNLNGKNFKCPAHGYWDFDGWVDGNEVCFDSDGKWCATAKKNAGTRFGTSTSTFLSETRDMTFEEEIDYWFKNTALNEVTLEAVMSGKYETAKDIWEKIVLVDFKKNYLNGHNELPEFIKNSDAFKDGYKKVAEKFENLKAEWKQELDEKKENGKITEEQYNETIKKLDDIDENLAETGKDYSERFDVIKASLEDLPVEDVDICKSDSKSLKVFQVIGYFLLIAKIIAPIILIILGSITFAKAALSNDEKATMDAAVMFGKKVLIGLIIFFVPTVLDFGLSLVSGVSDTMQKFENCTACIFSPNDSGRCSPQNLQDGSDDSTSDDNGGSNGNTDNSSNNGNNSNNDKNSTGNTYGYDCYYEYKNAKGQLTSVGYNKNGSVTLIQHDGKKINKSVSSGQNEGTSKYETDECYPLITVTLKELPQHSGYKVSYKIGKTQDDVSMGKTNSPRTAKLVTN